jgi:hypothetical protein
MTNKQELTTAPRGRSVVPVDAFERFWDAYPRKMAREKARQEFMRLVRNGLATADELIDGAGRYAAWRRQADGGDPCFTKFAWRWLNEESWRDTYDEAPAAPKGHTANLQKGASAAAAASGVISKIERY